MPNGREAAFKQIDEIVKAARAALPGTADPLEGRASQIEARVSQLASIPTSIAQAQELISEIKKLESDTRSTLASQRNPWGIRASAAQDSQHFNQVVTLSVPSGQTFQLEYHRARSNGCTERGRVSLEGTFSDLQTSAGKVWRQPDPNKPGFDTITVATYEQHCERTRCGGIQREAFRGYLTLKEPCGGPAVHVNINNGHNNDHLGAGAEGSSVELSPEALASAGTTTPARPYDDVDLGPSPSDDWRGAGFKSFEEYIASFKEPKEQPAATLPVGMQKEHFKVVLKPGETLFAYRDSSLEGTVTYDRNKPGEVTRIGLDAAEARFARELPNGSREYEIDPASSSGARPLHFKIIRAGGGPDGLGFESLAEARVSLDSTEGVFRSQSEGVSTGVLASPDADEGVRAEERTHSDVVLPEAGSYASPTKPLMIQLGTGALQLLNFYEAGGSNVGTIPSTARENSWEFAQGAIRIERDRSPSAPPNRLLLYAGSSTEPRAFNLSVLSAATVESLGRTNITVGPDVPETQPSRETSDTPETQYASSVAPSSANTEVRGQVTGVSATTTVPRLVTAAKEEPSVTAVSSGESYRVDSDVVRRRESPRRPILEFVRSRLRR
jgi:hypothetical protein